MIAVEIIVPPLSGTINFFMHIILTHKVNDNYYKDGIALTHSYKIVHTCSHNLYIHSTLLIIIELVLAGTQL